LADEFLKQFSAAVNQLKFGMPWQDGVALTPLPEPHKPTYLKECLADAIAHGAKIMNENGGATNESFVFPAVVYPVNSKMKLYTEEQFGPCSSRGSFR
jgi:glyceraldehyde-3-phosphate dehydrogenase (NADP+)